MKPIKAIRKSPLTLLLALAMSAGSLAHGQANPIEPKYDYPFTNPFVSTLSGAVAHSNLTPKTLFLEFREDRRHVPYLEGRNKVSVRLFKQAKPAPLMFVIPGLGGFSGSGAATLLAETYFNAGYNVISLPNNLSWQYAVGVSETALPGFMPRDSAEYYQFMKFVTEAVQAQENMQITSYAVSGFSLGGLLSAFLANEDAQQKYFQFQKVILINPAIDVAFGIETLDKMQAAGNELTAAKKTADMSFIFNLGADLLQAPMDVANLQKVAPKLSKLNDTEIRWVIGQSFRNSVRDVIVASQRVNDSGLLKSQTSKTNLNAVLAEAANYSFTDYMNLFVFPSLKGNRLSRSEVLAQSSLYSLTSFLKSNPNIYVFENADDLIIKPTDLEFLQKTLTKSHLILYPYGGHLGNLWWEKNRKDLMEAAKFIN